MNALLIDPICKTVLTVELAGSGIDEIYKAMSSIGLPVTCFSCPVTLPNMDTLFCDEEALFKEGLLSFKIEAYPEPLFGAALLLGGDKEGNSISVKTNIIELNNMIKFDSQYMTTGNL